MSGGFQMSNAEWRMSNGGRAAVWAAVALGCCLGGAGLARGDELQRTNRAEAKAGGAGMKYCA